MLERGLFLAEPQPFSLRNFGCAASGHNLSYAHAYPDAPALIEHLKADKPHGKTILIKGSNGIRLSSVVEYL